MVGNKNKIDYNLFNDLFKHLDRVSLVLWGFFKDGSLNNSNCFNLKISRTLKHRPGNE